MNLTVLSRTVAKLMIRRILVQSTVGGFELVISLDGDSTPDPTHHYWATLDSATVKIGPWPGELHPLGTARPDRPVRLRTFTNTSAVQVELKLPLSPSQLGAIEQLRGAADLQLQILAIGEGGPVAEPASITAYQEMGHHVVPRSDWIEQLRAAKFREILLIEVAMPHAGAARLADVIKGLRKAQDRYADGHYTDAVFACRRAIESLAKAKGRPETWTTEAFKRLGGGPRTLNKSEREAVVEAAIYHFASLAAHDDSDGHVEFTRDEALFALRSTAALVAHLAA